MVFLGGLDEDIEIAIDTILQSEEYVGFKKLSKKIGKSGKAKDPDAVAAAIGRKKYGKAKFQKAAAVGKKLRK